MGIPKVEESLLEEQLQSEARLCAVCGYNVSNPLAERCPRCYALLPELNLSCNGCIHRTICPAGADAVGDPLGSRR